MKIILEILVLLARLVYFYLEAAYRLIIPPSPKSVRGQVVVITGGAAGIGRCLALKFAGLGAKVAVWDVNKTENAETAKAISSLGAKACAYVCDVTSPEAVREAAQKTRQDLGEVDILVNNAGIMNCRRLMELSEREIQNCININTVSHFWTVREFLPHMIEQKRGHIVTISSMAGIAGVPFLTDYCASKFGALGFAESLRAELRSIGAKGIYNTIVCPMHVNTNLVTGLASRVDYRNRFGGVSSPEEVADAIIDGTLRNYQIVHYPKMMSSTKFMQALVPRKFGPHIFAFMDTGFFEKKDR